MPIVVAQPTASPLMVKSPRVVILFVVDTLRKDRLSFYGYRPPTTLSIDRFFESGAIWTNAFSNVPWTLPSHATLFTSTFPNRHGVGERRQTIPNFLPTLAETFSSAGYRTVAVTNGFYVGPTWGFERGFDYYEASLDNILVETNRVLDLIDRYRGEPLLVFLHTYQVHNYLSVVPPSDPKAAALLGPFANQYPYHNIESLTSTYGESQVKTWMENRYDAALRGTDKSFATLVSGLASRHQLQSTGFILTADHGEEIFDRRYTSPDALAHFGHTHPYLFDEYLRVPLMLRIPWLRNLRGVFSEDVSLVDVAPSILETVGIECPKTFQGRSFLPHSVPGAPSGPKPPVIVKGPRYDSIAIRTPEHTLLRRTEFPLTSWDTTARFGRLEPLKCFDNINDPGQEHPVSCAQPWAATLLRYVDTYFIDQFPGSLVVRFAPSPGRTDYAIEARESHGRPQVFSFGLSPDGKFWTDRGSLFGTFPASRVPMWLAIQPAVVGDGTEVRLYGAPPLKTPYGAQVGNRRYAWSDLLWRASSASAPIPDIYSTAAEPSDSAERGVFTLTNFAKLRSLGYLNGPSSLSFPATQSLAQGSSKAEAGDLPSGHITLFIQGDVRPPFAAPLTSQTSRNLKRLEPPGTVDGVSFNSEDGETCSLKVVGAGFRQSDTVYWNGEHIATTYVNSQLLEAHVPTGYLAPTQEVLVSVRDELNPSSTTLTATFHVTPRGRQR